ncbi:hypothetical protein VZT92_005439 [Zoarces viviparus]|uniref:Uncharacterized protein n=1 Tax=Zoarces viviparus TaxID=48416 RepID=A0AAW1FVW1_ZOAVI
MHTVLCYVLLSQLDETETAFDEFWVRHQTKLEQCLQLRHFEHNYREVRALLDQVSEKLATFSEVGISPAHADHIFCELTTYEERVCEVLDRASSLACDGDDLIQNSHYAEDSIQPKCKELRAISENVSSNLRAKKDRLLKAMELHHCLERASKWVDDGIYLLASQPVDKCQSHEGAELALKELEQHLDTAGQNQLTELSTIWSEYEAVLNQQFRSGQRSFKRGEEKKADSCSPDANSSSLPKPTGKDEAVTSPTSDRAAVAKKRFTLQGFSNLKAQKGITQLTPCNDNDSMHLIAITGYEGNMSELGKLLMQGSFSVWTEHKKGHAKVKDLARFKPMQRHLFLHEKALLFCKRREENGEGYEKAPSYSFKQSLNMSAVGITENAKGDNKKFEIWCNSREEVYIVQAPTADVKTTWVNEIRKVLTTQLEACRASQQRAPDPVFQFPPVPSGSVSLSPFKSGQRSFKRGEEKKADSCSPDANSSSLPKPTGKDEAVTSPTSDRAAVAKKRFTLQGFSNLKAQKESSTTDDKSFTLPSTMIFLSPGSPDQKTKRQSDPTPFGFKDAGPPPLHLSRARWFSTPSLLQTKWRGWNKTSLSLDASEEHDGYSSAEDPLNSDPEDDIGKKLCAGKYTVMADYEKDAQELSVKSGDMVELVKEGEDGQWFVRNLSSSKEGWIAAANLIKLIGKSKSCQSLTSSEGSGSGNLSTSSSCSETDATFPDIKP